jgi:hypothetical protein
MDIEPKTILRIALVSRRAEQSPAARTYLTCALDAIRH